MDHSWNHIVVVQQNRARVDVNYLDHKPQTNKHTYKHANKQAHIQARMRIII